MTTPHNNLIDAGTVDPNSATFTAENGAIYIDLRTADAYQYVSGNSPPWRRLIRQGPAAGPNGRGWSTLSFEASLVAADADVVRIVHVGPDVTIEALGGVIAGGAAIATADATVTAAINGVPVTDGVLTFAVADALDDTAAASPTANNVMTQGDVLTLSVGGGSTGVGTIATFNAALALV